MLAAIWLFRVSLGATRESPVRKAALIDVWNSCQEIVQVLGELAHPRRVERHRCRLRLADRDQVRQQQICPVFGAPP